MNTTQTGGAPLARTQAATPNPDRPNPRWVLSAVVSIVFFPIGLVALLFSYLSNERYEQGNMPEAKRYSRYARNWSIALIAFESVIVAVFVAWFVFIGSLIHSDFNNVNPLGSSSPVHSVPPPPVTPSSSSIATIPSLYGLDNVGAADALENVGLQWKEVDHASSTVPFGDVVSSTPPSGTKVSNGSTVTIVVSCGTYMAGFCQ